MQLLSTRCSRTALELPVAWKPGGTGPDFLAPQHPGCLEIITPHCQLCSRLWLLSSLLKPHSLPALGYCDRICSPGNSSPKVAIETPGVGVWRKGCDSSQLMHRTLHSLKQHRIRPVAFLTQFEPPQSVEEEDTILLLCVSGREKKKKSPLMSFNSIWRKVKGLLSPATSETVRQGQSGHPARRVSKITTSQK